MGTNQNTIWIVFRQARRIGSESEVPTGSITEQGIETDIPIQTELLLDLPHPITPGITVDIDVRKFQRPQTIPVKPLTLCTISHDRIGDDHRRIGRRLDSDRSSPFRFVTNKRAACDLVVVNVTDVDRTAIHGEITCKGAVREGQPSESGVDGCTLDGNVIQKEAVRDDRRTPGAANRSAVLLGNITPEDAVVDLYRHAFIDIHGRTGIVVSARDRDPLQTQGDGVFSPSTIKRDAMVVLVGAALTIDDTGRGVAALRYDDDGLLQVGQVAIAITCIDAVGEFDDIGVCH